MMAYFSCVDYTVASYCTFIYNPEKVICSTFEISNKTGPNLLQKNHRNPLYILCGKAENMN